MDQNNNSIYLKGSNDRASELAIEKILFMRLKIDKYNESLMKDTNSIDEYKYKFQIPVVYTDNNREKMKSTGWYLYDMDVKAIEDFLLLRNNNTMQEVLKYALRNYIPTNIYYDIYNNYIDIKNINDSSYLAKYIEEYGNLESYHKSVEYEPVYIDKKYNKYKSKPGWNIPYIDYLAATAFYYIFNISYQDIVTNALRFYLTNENYKHAEEMLDLIEKHKENQRSLLLGDLYDKLNRY